MAGCTYVANFMDHGSSKTPAGLVSNTTGLGSTQTTLLEYHMQEWIGHMHYMQDAVSWENGPSWLGSSLAPLQEGFT
jgi:hypothetical protein